MCVCRWLTEGLAACATWPIRVGFSVMTTEGRRVRALILRVRPAGNFETCDWRCRWSCKWVAMKRSRRPQLENTSSVNLYLAGRVMARSDKGAPRLPCSRSLQMPLALALALALATALPRDASIPPPRSRVPELCPPLCRRFPRAQGRPR